MGDSFFKSLIFTVWIALGASCAAQTGKVLPDQNKSQPNVSPVVKRVPSETDQCWKEFRETIAKVSVKFCGEPKKDVLDGVFKGEKIKRTSYLVLDGSMNGNARYFLAWFDWKLKSVDEASLRK